MKSGLGPRILDSHPWVSTVSTIWGTVVDCKFDSRTIPYAELSYVYISIYIYTYTSKLDSKEILGLILPEVLPLSSILRDLHGLSMAPGPTARFAKIKRCCRRLNASTKPMRSGHWCCGKASGQLSCGGWKAKQTLIFGWYCFNSRFKYFANIHSNVHEISHRSNGSFGVEPSCQPCTHYISLYIHRKNTLKILPVYFICSYVRTHNFHTSIYHPKYSKIYVYIQYIHVYTNII